MYAVESCATDPHTSSLMEQCLALYEQGVGVGYGLGVSKVRRQNEERNDQKMTLNKLLCNFNVIIFMEFIAEL